MRNKLLLPIILTTALGAQAQSAELVILEREAAEAKRYYAQVHQQVAALDRVQDSAKVLRDKATRALEAAKKREAQLVKLQRNEELLARSRVTINEYDAVDYAWTASDKDVAARLHGYGK